MTGGIIRTRKPVLPRDQRGTRENFQLWKGRGTHDAAGPCKRLDPKTGEVVEIVGRDEGTPAAPTPQRGCHALSAVSLTTSAPVIGAPKLRPLSGSPVAVRQRRHQALRKRGVAVYEVPVPEAVLDAIVRWHWITERDVTDAAKVAKAIADGLAEAAASDLLRR